MELQFSYIYNLPTLHIKTVLNIHAYVLICICLCICTYTSVYVYLCICIERDRQTDTQRQRETFPLGSTPAVLEGVKLALASRKL